MVRNLRIIRLIRHISLAHRTHLSSVIHLNDIGRDNGLRRAPDEPCGHEQRQQQTTKGHEPPVFSLDASRANTIVPGLSSRLIRCGRLWRLGVAHLRSFKAHGLSPYESASRRLGPCPAPPPSPPCSVWAAV